MYQYALLMYYILGAIKPTSESIAANLPTMPGGWPTEDTPNPDEVIFTRVLTSFPSWKKSVNFAFVFTGSALMLFWCVTLFNLLPVLLCVFVFYVFGPIALVTAAWTWFAAISAVVIMLVHLMSTYWLSIVSTASDYAAIQWGGQAMSEALSSATDNLELCFAGRPPESFRWNGLRWTLASLADDTIPVSDRYAVATYWLYCPTRYERGSTTFFAASFFGLYFVKTAYAWVKRSLRMSYLAFRAWLIVLTLLVCGSDRLAFAIGDFLSYFMTVIAWPFARYILTGDFRSAVRFVRVLWLLACLKALNLAYRLSILAAKKTADVKGFTDSTMKWRAMWNNAIMDFTRALDKISVPNFIRSLPDRFDRDAINEGQRILEELGWPIAPPVTEEYNDEPDNIDKYADFIIGGTAIRQGIHRAELMVADELANLKGLAPEYKRTEQYATVENELESLARYFKEPEGDFPELPIDDIWVLVSDIFANSRLTPFAYIIKKWEKRYGLGPLWGTVNSKGKFKKMSRKTFIKTFKSYGDFVKLWAETFYTAHLIPAPAPVSVKSEALPPKKWMADKVRTIIGAPITHYISSTLWNYMPNHNFKFWSTSIKIGMPLNGACLSRLVRQHSTYDFHFAGDFSDFDSTLMGEVLKVVAKVRKKGFEHHRDYAKICFLIDANYKGLERSPMMTTSTGNVYSKQGALSTGHSSTGMDNSLACDVLYLLVWRKLTGLSAHEFRHYCKLSNYGDDHLLSWLATAPASWTPANIIKAMKTMNTTLRDEFPKFDRDGNPVAKTMNDYRNIDGLEFLSKIWRRPTANDVLEMSIAGIPVPEWLIIHNPMKLVGKAYAPSKDFRVNRDYRIKRLIGYMYLTAHQQDIYNKLALDLETLRRRKDGSLMPCSTPIPTYAEVLTTWYDEKSHVTAEDTDFTRPDYDPILDYSLDGLADTLVNILSVVPDVLNPAIYNMGYVNWVVSTFGAHVSWPVELVRRANSTTATGALTALGKRTFYDFLFENPRVVAQDVRATNSDLLLRHWLFTLLRPRPSTLNPLAFLQWADKKIAEVNFVLNGYVQPYVKRFELPVLDLLLIAALDFVSAPKMPDFITTIHIPAIGSIVEFVYGLALNTMWSNIPANMKQSYSALDTLSPESSCVLIEAPTGTGKSTAFVNYVWRYFGFRYTRVVLVVPRSLLVTTLTPYLVSAFNLPAMPVTDGHPFQSGFRLIVTTPNEVLLHTEWLEEGNLFLVDEAHLMEPAVIAVRDMLATKKHPHVLLTATPSSDLLTGCSVHVPLQIASTWTIVDDERADLVIKTEIANEREYWYRYRTIVLDMLRSRTLAKVLVFVANKSHARELAGRLKRRSCILTATDRTIDLQADIIIATAVADVGLTIPDVDWVITSDLTRTKDPVTDDLLWIRMDALLTRQRRGRTGRTSNGLFTVVRFPRALFVRDAPQWRPEEVGLEVLRSTGSANLVTAFWPSTMARILALDLEAPGAQAHLDSFIKNFGVLSEVMEPENQRTYRTTIDGVTETQSWHIAGNTLPTSIPDMDPDREYCKPLSIRQGWDFLVGAAHYATSAGVELTTDFVRLYTRSEHISARKFKSTLRERPPGTALATNTYASLEPSGRYGTVRALATYAEETEDSLFEGFSTFADPKPVDRMAPIRKKAAAAAIDNPPRLPSPKPELSRVIVQVQDRPLTPPPWEMLPHAPEILSEPEIDIMEASAPPSPWSSPRERSLSPTLEYVDAPATAPDMPGAYDLPEDPYVANLEVLDDAMDRFPAVDLVPLEATQPAASTSQVLDAWTAAGHVPRRPNFSPESSDSSDSDAGQRRLVSHGRQPVYRHVSLRSPDHSAAESSSDDESSDDSFLNRGF